MSAPPKPSPCSLLAGITARTLTRIVMGSVTKIGAGDIPKTAGRYITAAGRSRGLRYPRSPIWEAGTARIIGRCFTKAGSWKVPRPCRSSIRDGVTAGQSPDGMLGGGYAKDSWSVYYRGRKVEGVSASSFEYLGGGYGKDPWKVVYQGREVPGASSSSFEELGWGYARDAWKVYYCGEVIPGASPATFRIPDRR